MTMDSPACLPADLLIHVESLSGSGQIKRPTGERPAPIFGAVGPHAALALDPRIGKLVPRRVNRLEHEIATIDLDNDTGLGVVDDQLALRSQARARLLLLREPRGTFAVGTSVER
jgi:hypothetical protein